MAETYAIVETGGKQYRAAPGTTLLVDRLPDDEGAKVDLRPVMFRGDKDVVLEARAREGQGRGASPVRAGAEDPRVQVQGEEGLPQARRATAPS